MLVPSAFVWEIRHPGVTWYKSDGAQSFNSTNSARFRNNQITCIAAFLPPVCFPLMVYYSTALGIVVCIDHNIPDCAWRQQSVSWHESERARSFIVTNSCKPTEQAQSCSSVYITISALLISLHWCTFLGAENATHAKADISTVTLRWLLRNRPLCSSPKNISTVTAAIVPKAPVCFPAMILDRRDSCRSAQTSQTNLAQNAWY